MHLKRFIPVVLLVLSLTLLHVRTATPADPPPKRTPPSMLETQSDGPELVGGKTFTKWKEDLSDPDPSVREKAIRAIPNFGKRAEEAVPLIRARCGPNETDASPRCRAVMTLSAMHSAGMIPEKEITAVVKVL